MTIQDDSRNYQSFIDYLVAALPVNGLDSASPLVLQYDGPDDWKIKRIQQSLAAMAERVNPNKPSSDISPAEIVDPEDTSAPTSNFPPAVTFLPDPPHRSLRTKRASFVLPDMSSIAFLRPPSPGSPSSTGVSAPTAVLNSDEEVILLKTLILDVVRVCGAVATGDLTQKITAPVQTAEMVQLRGVVNGMVDNLNYFAAQAARSVSQDIEIGGVYSQTPTNVSEGIWRDLTDGVNKLVVGYTNHIRSTAMVTNAIVAGDLSKQIDIDAVGEVLELKGTVNAMVVDMRAFTAEVTRVTVGASHGVLGGQIYLPNAKGVWLDLTSNINHMLNKMTVQTRSTAMVVRGVAMGDFTRRFEVDAEGEMAELKNMINIMADRLTAFASEISRVTLEVGTQGLLGVQATIDDVEGVWVQLTRGVNSMAISLTSQVRAVSEVVTAIASGDLSMRITVDAQGEMMALKVKVNEMADQLTRIASEVSRVSLEVGKEGKLGERMRVVNVSGTWQEVQENVNLMSTNLRTQVRSVADMTGAVASGSLTERVTVDMRGEMLDLKANVNRIADSLNGFTDDVNRAVKEVLSSASRLAMSPLMRRK